MLPNDRGLEKKTSHTTDGEVVNMLPLLMKIRATLGVGLNIFQAQTCCPSAEGFETGSVEAKISIYGGHVTHKRTSTN